LVDAINHVRADDPDCKCDLCTSGADTAQKVRDHFPDEWFGDKVDLVDEVVAELAAY
jgi:hypothetical protein